MILELKKDKILLVALIVLLSITVYNLKYSLNSKAIETTNVKPLKNSNYRSRAWWRRPGSW